MTTRVERSPLEQCIAERDKFQEEVERLRGELQAVSKHFEILRKSSNEGIALVEELMTELQRHREALEKAKSALDGCDQVTGECWVEDVREAISTINDLLDKKGDK